MKLILLWIVANFGPLDRHSLPIGGARTILKDLD